MLFRSDVSHIKDDTPIDLHQVDILHRLQTEGAMTFARIFEGKKNCLAFIGLFLALLELIREKLVWAEQEKDKGSLFLKSLTEEPAEQAVQNAIVAAEAENRYYAEIEVQEQMESEETEISAGQIEEYERPTIKIMGISEQSGRGKDEKIDVSNKSEEIKESSIPMSELPGKSEPAVFPKSEEKSSEGEKEEINI